MVLLLFDCPHKSVCNLASAMCVAQAWQYLVRFSGAPAPSRCLSRARSHSLALWLFLYGDT
jgi:hypothetical protein